MRASPKKEMRLTKTAYLNYLRCPAEFWLEYHELLMAAREVTLEHEHIRQQGYEVERYARQLKRFSQDQTDVVVDFQRVFQTQDLAARSDIVLANKTTGEIEIFEIKGAASVKEEHLQDVAFQMLTSEKMGFIVSRAHVVTMNGDYVRQGEIDPEQLFVITDVTDQVREMMPDVERKIAEAFAYLQTLPVPSLEDYCLEHKLDCRFTQMHLGPFPEYTVFDISFLKHDKRRELLSNQIVDIKEVPDDFPLSPKQRSQVDVAKSGEIVIKREKIRERMDQWEYPLQFLDYETFAYAVPQFDGIKPFQQMVFQYSLHTISEPGGGMEHTGFLSEGGEFPAREVAEHMRDAFSGGIGTVFVWYEAFEKGRNTEMAEMFPDLANFFNELNEHTVDLMKVFSDNLYIHPDFKGKTSIKKVLPVLCPHLRYDTLGIQEGMTATIKWYRAAKWPSLDEAERRQIFNDLDAYCHLDTLAMVEIFNCLKNECKDC